VPVGLPDGGGSVTRPDTLVDELHGRLQPSGCGMDGQRDAVHAVAQSGWLRPVSEDMAQMPPAADAVHLGSVGTKAGVGACSDRLAQRLPETGPTGAAVELGG